MQCEANCGREISGEEDEGVCVACWSELEAKGEEQCTTCSNLLIWYHEYELGICDDCLTDDEDKDVIKKHKTATNSPWWNEYANKRKGFKLKPTVKCTHEGMPLVFTLGQGKVYASGERDSLNWKLDKVDLIIALNGHPETTIRFNEAGQRLLRSKGGFKTFPELKPIPPMPYISINWPDGSSPPFGKSYVEGLIHLIEAGTNVLIHCVGGHGRTGTLLAAICAKKTTAKDPIIWVRENYCKKAVETKRQREWLTENYNFKTEEESTEPEWSPCS